MAIREINTCPVCVVGAGPAGLVATKTLIQAGLDVDCFESSSVVGGHWVIDNPSGRSSAYRSLRTNTTKRMSRLSDYQMPDDWPEFPGHELVRRWFDDYIDRFGFRHHIATGHEVQSAEPHPDGGWTVTVRGPDGERFSRTYRALVAASGNYRYPKSPSYTGHFDGSVIHAQQYRDPASPCDTRGNRVVVVGTGNTGCELACEIAGSGAAAVYISARSGNWILPKTINGRPASDAAPMTHPCDPVLKFLRPWPARWRNRLFVALTERAVRQRFAATMQRLLELGLPPPPPRPLSKRPTVSQDLLQALESGAIRARPAIERLAGSRVVFSGGEQAEADVIVNATGYHLRYPYLPSPLVDTANDDLNLYLGTLHPTRHDLFVVGVSRPTGAFWPIAEVQARFAAELLTGRYALPGTSAIARGCEPVLRRPAFNPALYALAVTEELHRGARRAKRYRKAKPECAGDGRAASAEEKRRFSSDASSR